MRVLLIALAVLGLVGCGSGAAPTATPTTTPSAEPREVATGCKRDAAGATAVHFDAVGGGKLGGLVLGGGPVGVVLAHQIDGTLCQWLPYGKTLAARGYRVLALDLGGFGSSEHTALPDQDVKQATTYLRAQGVRSVVLMGASLGGTASLSAGVMVEPPVAAVVSLSGPVHASGMDLSVRIQALNSPVLYAAGTYDMQFAQDARTLYDSTPGARRKLVLVEQSSHGVALLSDPAVSSAIDKFLATYAPPG